MQRIVKWLLLASCLVFLCPSLAGAQNVLDALLGQGKGTKLQIRTPEARLLIEAQERLSKVNQRIERFQKKYKERILLWEKETRRYRDLVAQYQVRMDYADWRNAPELVRLRSSLVAMAEQNINMVSQLQAAFASREQNLLSLRDTLQNYQKTKKTIEQILRSHYITTRLRDKLAADLEKVRAKLAESHKDLAESKAQLRTLAADYELNQKKLDQARRQLVQKLPEPGQTSKPEDKQPTPRAKEDSPKKPEPRAQPKQPLRPPIPGLRAPSSGERKPGTRRPASRGSDKPQEREKPTKSPGMARPRPRTAQQPLPQEELLRRRQNRYKEMLEGMSGRLRFDAYRLQAQWLRVRQRDEAVEQEIAMWRIRLYEVISEQMMDGLKLLVAHSKEGLWYRRDLQWDRSLFAAVGQRTMNLVKRAPEHTKHVWNKLRSGWQSLDQGSALFLLFLGLCGIIALFIMTRTTRARLEQSMQRLSAKVEGSRATRAFWQTLLLMFRSVYALLPFFGVLVVLGTLFWALRVPANWQTMLWSLGLVMLVLRALDVFTRQLFHPDSAVRLFRNLDDVGARRFRRVIHAFLLFTLVYFPIILAVPLLGYPEAFLHLLKVGFYGFLVLCLLLLLLNQSAILSLIPADSVLGRATVLMIYRLYPMFFLLALGLFGIYAYGYTNFATFLARGILFTSLVVIMAVTAYRLFWSFGLVLFGFSRESEGLVKIEKKMARNLLLLGRFLLGIMLSLVSLSLLLEIWGVAGGFRTIIKLFNSPFLQIKDTQLTALSLIKFAMSLAGAVLLARWIREKSDKYVYPALRLSRSNRHAANTVLVYSILIMGFLFGLQWMGMGLGVLTVFAGIIGIGVGFGLQNIASNFISGLMITFGKPIKVGDVIEVGDLLGEVKEISARSTTIEMLDSRVVLIPNAEILTTKVINWSMGQPYIMAKLAVGVAYGSDVSLVLKTLKEVALSHSKVLREPVPALRFDNFGSSSLDFGVWVAIANPLERFEVLSELRVRLDQRFRELNITIAFPQQDVHLDDDLQNAIIQSLQQQEKKPLPSKLEEQEESEEKSHA